jgi:tRNA dimethylallyltransferase
MTLVIYGPTATGKTALGINLAKKFDGELISADSRQVYRTLDIGTGKVSFESRVQKHKNYWIVDGVRINGFDLIEPQAPFSVAQFIDFASKKVKSLKKNGKTPIIVGGTGYYIKALISPIAAIGIPQNKKLRLKLAKLTAAKLYEKLQKLDTAKARSMNESDRQNPRRLIRGIEIAQSHKSPVQNSTKALADYLLIGLTAPNELLYKKVDQWLQTRLENGMIEEVDGLLKNGVSSDWLKGLGLEYKWLTLYLEGAIGKDEAVTGLRGDIHGFVRRQKTWLPKLTGIHIFDISKNGWQEKLEKTLDEAGKDSSLPIKQG